MSGTGVKEGQGVTITFGTQTIILNLVDINQDGITVADINCSDQSTLSFEEYVPATLAEGGTYTCLVNWNLKDQVALYAGLGVLDVITFTYPKNETAAVTPASDSFDGYINSITKVAQKEQLIQGTIVFKVAKDITFVDESAAP